MSWQFILDSFADDLHEHPLRSTSVELAVEDLFPGSEVEFSFGDSNDDLSTHDLPLQMRVGIVLAGPVVLVTLGRGVERGELFEPGFIILVQARLIIVDEHTGGDMHGVHEDQSLGDAALTDCVLNPRRDVEKAHPAGKLERQILGVRFQWPDPLKAVLDGITHIRRIGQEDVSWVETQLWANAGLDPNYQTGKARIGRESPPYNSAHKGFAKGGLRSSSPLPIGGYRNNERSNRSRFANDLDESGHQFGFHGPISIARFASRASDGEEIGPERGEPDDG